MTWDELMLKHGKELSKFFAAKTDDWAKMDKKESRDEVDKWNYKWALRYKALVQRHFEQAKDLHEKLERIKEDMKKVGNVVVEAAKAAAWLDTQMPSTLENPDRTMMEKIELLDEYEKEKDAERKERLRKKLEQEGILKEEQSLREKMKEAMDKIGRRKTL